MHLGFNHLSSNPFKLELMGHNGFDSVKDLNFESIDLHYQNDLNSFENLVVASLNSIKFPFMEQIKLKGFDYFATILDLDKNCLSLKSSSFLIAFNFSL
jgi:hypothetical protein